MSLCEAWKLTTRREGAINLSTSAASDMSQDIRLREEGVPCIDAKNEYWISLKRDMEAVRDTQGAQCAVCELHACLRSLDRGWFQLPEIFDLGFKHSTWVPLDDGTHLRPVDGRRRRYGVRFAPREHKKHKNASTRIHKWRGEHNCVVR